MWILLLVLTLTILTFPTHLTLQSGPIQSIAAIPNLDLFAVVYCFWLLVLAFLLFSGKRSSLWEKLGLIIIFGLVFIGYWLFTGSNTVLRYDGLGNAAYVRYLDLQPDGKIPLNHPNLVYYGFPGMHLFTFALVKVTGLSLLHSVTVILIFSLVLQVGLIYTLILRTLNNPLAAALGSMVGIQGNIMMARYSFYSNIWVLILIVLFFILVNRQGDSSRRTWQETTLILLLLVSATITHVVGMSIFFFVLVGIYVTRIISARTLKSGLAIVSVPTLFIFIIVPLTWLIYQSMRWFSGSISGIVAVVQNFKASGQLTYFLHLSSSYIGSDPLWAVLVRYFWLVMVYLLGTILGLRNLLKRKNLSLTQQIETGGLIGIVLLSTLITLVSPGGAEFYRFVLYGAFFTIPIVFRFLLSLNSDKKRMCITIAIALLFILSFPTFLVHNNTVSLSNVYDIELQSVNFLRQLSGNQGDGLTIYNDPDEIGLMLFGVPDATYVTTPQASNLNGEEEYWQAVEKAIVDFEKPNLTNDSSTSLFYMSQRRISSTAHLLGISPQDPRWQQLDNRLVENNQIYANNYVHIYERSVFGIK